MYEGKTFCLEATMGNLPVILLCHVDALPEGKADRLEVAPLAVLVTEPMFDLLDVDGAVKVRVTPPTAEGC